MSNWGIDKEVSYMIFTDELERNDEFYKIMKRRLDQAQAKIMKDGEDAFWRGILTLLQILMQDYRNIKWKENEVKDE